MAIRTITVFYAWQSDTPSKFGRHFIRRALDDAAERINKDPAFGNLRIAIDADTEGEVGTPPVTETILKKLAAAEIFAPDLTFVATTEGGKLVPNPNVMIEYGYALRALSFEAMMPIMNTHFGPPEKLPFDMGHVRHPTKFEIAPNASDGERRAARTALSDMLEGVIRAMVAKQVQKARQENPFAPRSPVRPPSFFFNQDDLLANFGAPGEQEMRFKRSTALFVRMYPTYADQPKVGLVKVMDNVRKLKPMANVISALATRNDFGAISLVPHGDGIASLTQMFETGELWGLSEQPFQSGQYPALVSIGAEKAYVAAIENYLQVYTRDLQLRPPYTLQIGATGLKGLYLLVPSEEFPNGQLAGPMQTDTITRSYQLETTDEAEWHQALREFLIDLYDLAVVSREKVITDRHVEANDLPPR